MLYAIAFGAAGIVVQFFILLVRAYANSRHIVDDPTQDAARRMHTRPIPLLGGLAVFASIFTVAFYFGFIRTDLVTTYLNAGQLVWFFIGGFILMLGGYLDDRYGLPAPAKLALPVLASLAVVFGGIGVNFITNPFGGVWRIDQIKLPVTLAEASYFVNLGSALFTVIWLSVLMYTTKVLDGLDGLVSGIGFIGAATIFTLCLLPPVLQPDTALFAAIIAGAFFGFLPHNWHPAKQFLGESGSLLAGYTIGVLSIIAGGKMATAALVMGLPLLDAFVVVVRRVLERKSIFSADRSHLHFVLVDLGLGVRGSVAVFFACSAAFGAAALFLQSTYKLYALAFLGVLAGTIIFGLPFAKRVIGK
ncbi:MAG: MraY family glycosyltransferase [Patescibacteria group bacterium]